MRQVLLATTALFVTAGIATAQDKLPGVIEDVVDEGPSVVLSGSAEIGVSDEGNDQDLEFHTDIDVTFTMSGTADNGLQFGANIDLDESDSDQTLDLAVDDAGNVNAGDDEDIEIGGSPAFDDDLQGGESIFIANGFGTLTMGDTDGAFDWALQEIAIGGSIDDNEEHAGFNGNSGLDGTYDGQIARYEYTFGDFSIALSGEISDEDPGEPVYGIGARYSTELFGTGVGFGVGYQRTDEVFGNRTLRRQVLDEDDLDEDGAIDDFIIDEEEESDVLVGEDAQVYGVSADLTLAFGLRVIVNYSKSETDVITVDGAQTSLEDGDIEHYGIALGYAFRGFNIGANYGRFERDDVFANVVEAGVTDVDVDDDSEGYGVNVNYDLGGGIEAQFGYGHSDVDGDEDEDTYSLGLSMAF